jgi:tetraacyldisaccharide 4'-kinase
LIQLTQKIEAVMTGKKIPGPLLHFLLTLLSMLYGIGVRLRTFLYDQGVFQTRKLPCAVISIGNLTVGGTGKTPMTIYLAQLLRDIGYKPAVISRGYKGLAEKKGGIVSDRQKVFLSPEVAGDEPFMMAQKLTDIPVLVGADRFRIGMKAVEQFSPDVIIFDDAFQHRHLERDLEILLVDDKTLFGNRCLLPRGILREPVSEISRSDLLVLTRCSERLNSGFNQLAELAPGKPIFKSFHEPYVYGVFSSTDKTDKKDTDRFSITASQSFDFLKMAKVIVFSGIAKNGDFQATVANLVGGLLGAIGFSDHHQYTESDFRLIAAKAKESSAEFLVTTEKDYVKIAGKLKSPVDIVVIGIGVSFHNDERRFIKFIKDKVDHIAQ